MKGAKAPFLLQKRLTRSFYHSIINHTLKLGDYIMKKQIISSEWKGQDGNTYRSVKFWVGTGYTYGFLQIQDDLLNWKFV